MDTAEGGTCSVRLVGSPQDPAGRFLVSAGHTARLELMSDLSPSERLAKLTALEEWLEWQLGDTRRKIRETEQAIEEERRRRERAHAELNFKIEPKRAGRDAKLHRGGCNLYTHQMGFITRGDALIALDDEGTPIEPCAICNPMSALGLPAS